MIPESGPGRTRRGAGAGHAIGCSVSSLTGLGGSITVAIEHGTLVMVMVVFAITQFPFVCEMIFYWALKWRQVRFLEKLFDEASSRLDDPNARTLALDYARTYLLDIGERLPVRPELNGTIELAPCQPTVAAGESQTDGPPTTDARVGRRWFRW